MEQVGDLEEKERLSGPFLYLAGKGSRKGRSASDTIIAEA